MAKVTEDPPWLVKQWTNWVQQALQKSNLSNKQIAEAGGFNASYISLMLRGNIPRRQIVQALGKALGKEAEALLMGGYVPHRGYVKALANAMKQPQPALTYPAATTEERERERVNECALHPSRRRGKPG